MERSARWLMVVLALAACREAGSDADRDRLPDVATRMGSAAQQDSEPGIEFEAPRLIPAVRAQMAEIGEPEGATEGNLTALRNGAGTLINAMEADLNRIGVTDTGYFYVLGDSVLREFGGGGGNVASISPEEGREVTARIDQLIRMYEERMRAAGH